MTDPDLVHRAEQAYLGSLLTRHGHLGTGAVVAGDAGPDGFASLRPGDFTDPVHQAIYAAIARQAAPPRGAMADFWDRLRGLLFRLLHRQAHDASTYMADLPDLCPDPANLAAYAAMITEASAQRATPAPVSATEPNPRPAVTENPRLANAGAWLESSSSRRRPSGGRRATAAADVRSAQTDPADPTAIGLAPDAARLARALRADARSAAQQTRETTRTPSPEDIPAPLDAEALEEQVLADLMLRPDAGREVASWLPDTVFTNGSNRVLYQLISVRLAEGRPVDPLIIAWDASLLRDHTAISEPPETETGESLAAAALRLGALVPGPDTAAVLGRALYADQVCNETFGLTWPTHWRHGQVPPLTEPVHSSAWFEPAPSAVVQAPSVAMEQAEPTAAAAAASAIASRAPAVSEPNRRPTPDSRHPAPSLPLRRPPTSEPAGPAPVQEI